MDEPDTTDTPASEPETRSVLKPDIIAILGVGLALIAVLVTATGLILATTHRIDARLDSAIAEAAADRRASDAKMAEFRNRMDEFNRHMRRL